MYSCGCDPTSELFLHGTGARLMCCLSHSVHSLLISMAHIEGVGMRITHVPVSYWYAVGQNSICIPGQMALILPSVFIKLIHLVSVSKSCHVQILYSSLRKI